MTEHWQTGGMTRSLPWLTELVPNMFVEISESLAKKKGIKKGDKVRVTTERGSIEAIALVTSRLKAVQCRGQADRADRHAWHFGYAGLATGDSANLLTPSVVVPIRASPSSRRFCAILKKGVTRHEFDTR